MPMNSPAERSKLTWSTASTVPRSRRYSTDKSRTSRTVPEAGAADLAGELSPGTLGPPPPYAPGRPEGRVADLVEGVVEQRERRAKQDDAQAGHDDPQGQASLEGLVVLGPVQHRAPAGHARVAEPDELQARGEQHRIKRVREEGRHQQRRHRGNDLHADDVQRTLAADLCRVEEVPVAQRQRLRAELARR